MAELDSFTIIAGLYQVLAYTTPKGKIGISWCFSLTYRALIIYCADQNIVLTWQSPVLVFNIIKI